LFGSLEAERDELREIARVIAEEFEAIEVHESSPTTD